MEIKTCEQYVLAKLAEDEDRLTRILTELQEKDKIIQEYKAFVDDLCGEGNAKYKPSTDCLHGLTHITASVYEYQGDEKFERVYMFLKAHNYL